MVNAGAQSATLDAVHTILAARESKSKDSIVAETVTGSHFKIFLNIFIFNFQMRECLIACRVLGSLVVAFVVLCGPGAVGCPQPFL